MIYYLISQILVIPLLVQNKVNFHRFRNVKNMWLWHRVILVLTLVLPLLMVYKPVKSPVPERVVREVVVKRFMEKEMAEPKEVVEVKPIPYVLPKIDTSISLSTYFLLIGVTLYLFTLIREERFIKQLKRLSIRKNRVDGIDIYYINRMITPFSYGVLKRSIYLPVNLTSSEEEIVLTHEMNHIRDFHLIWLNIEVLLKRIFWFNPLYIYLNREGIELREYLCDEKSIKNHNIYNYGEVLIRMTSKISPKSRPLMVGLGKKTELKKRIEQMTKERVYKKGIFNRVKPVAVLVMSLILSLTVPMQVIAETTVGFKSEFGADTAYEAFTKLCRDQGTISAVNEMEKYSKEIISSVPGNRDDYPFGSPVEEPARITLEWGNQKDPFTRKKYFHIGTDLAKRRGANILTSGNGLVITTGYNEKGYGYFIVILHSDGFVSRYAQLDKILVSKGDRVNLGDIIGKMGNTGRSTGPHLHYEVSYIFDYNSSNDIDYEAMKKFTIDSGWFLKHIYNPL